MQENLVDEILLNDPYVYLYFSVVYAEEHFTSESLKHSFPEH